MKGKSVMEEPLKYDDDLQENLQSDPAFLNEYLQKGLKDFIKTGKFDVFSCVLRHVVKAKGGMTWLSRKSGLKRINLYAVLSGNTSFQFKNFCKIINALGLTLELKKRRNDYLQNGLTDFIKTGEFKIFCCVLKQTVKAEGGMTWLSQRCGIHRNNLHGVLSGNTSFQFANFYKIINALGLTLELKKKKPVKTA